MLQSKALAEVVLRVGKWYKTLDFGQWTFFVWAFLSKVGWALMTLVLTKVQSIGFM